MERRFPYDRLVAAVDRRHRAILLVAAGLLVASGLSLLRLRLDMDVLSQLPVRSRVFRDYREFLQTSGVFDSLVVLVTGERDSIVSFADALAEQLARSPDIASIRYRIDLDDVRRRFLVPFRYELLSDDELGELARRLEPDAIEARVRNLRRALEVPMSLGARRWILEDPLGVEELVGRSLEHRYADPLFRPSSEYFLAPGGDALLFMVRPAGSAFDTIFTERLLGEVKSAEAELLEGRFRASGVRVGHTGSYGYALADRQLLQSDFRIYFLFAPLAVLMIFHLGLRTLRILPFVTFPLLVTTALTFALSLALFRSLNMISIAFAGIFYGLGIDSAIYFYSLLRDKAAARGNLDRGAIRLVVTETLGEIGLANVVASTTTAVAFLVVGFSDFSGVSQLGILTALAMLLNIVATFVLLPAMVFVWGPRAIPARPGRPSRFAAACARLSARLAERRAAVLVLVAIIVGAAGLALPRVRLDTDFTHLQPSGGEAQRLERVIRDKFGHVDAQGIALARAPDVDGCLRATERLAAVLDRYREQGLVRSYSSLTAFFPSAETASRRLARFRSLPRARAAAALQGSLAESGFDPGAFEGFLGDLVRDERSRITVEGQSGGPLAGLLEQHLRRAARGFTVATYFAPASGVSLATIRDRLRIDLPRVPLTVTGRELAESEFARLLARELAWFLGGSLLLNFLLVFVAERRIVSTLALLSPTLAALVVYLGLIGAFGVAIDPVNLVVLPLLIGLGVDDSVYLVAHMRYGGGLQSGIRRGATPLFLAVATTVAGFGSLGLSRFPALCRLGWLAAVGLSLCMAASLLLVPALAPALVGRERATPIASDERR
jgi:uncharacterized protein